MTSFIPLYPVRKGMFERIYAGGFHSFAVLNKVRQHTSLQVGQITLDSKEVVYTDTALAHRFLRFSVPSFKPDDEIGATEITPEQVVEFLTNEL